MTQVNSWLSKQFNLAKKVISARSFWASALLLCLCATMLYISVNLKLVYIRDSGTTILRHTLKSQPEHILSESGIATMAFDVVDFSGFEGKMGVINIDRAFPVTIKVDSREYNVMTTEVTVRELLKTHSIKISPNDQMNLSPAFYVSENDVIIINRINTTTYTEQVDIPFETEYKESPLLKKGRTTVLTRGKNGTLLRTYQDTLMDGALAERNLVSEKTLTEPVTQVVLVGANVPASKLDFGVPLDANGNPTSYRQVFRNQVATGYNAGTRAYGASLMYLETGFVAVRASQIPYGTKLYIKSADGSFVYGYAVAADTGLGLVNGVIDIDLYYDTYTESCLNGRKYLDVYVLDDSTVTKPYTPAKKRGWHY